METKTKAIVLGTFLAVCLSLLLATPMYARPTFGPNCTSCHTNGGITITSNVTHSDVLTSGQFGVEVNAEGDAPGLTVIYSSIADNPVFGFVPSSVVDNGAGDANPDVNKVKGFFSITSPSTTGLYTIQVFAAGDGAKAGTLMLQINVSSSGQPTGNLLPTASFLYSRHGMTIGFEDGSWDVDGNITSWQWNFGDNTTSTEQNPTHTYGQTGTYTVTLTVTDDKGGSNTRSQAFMVPSNEELFQLWILQVFYGSLIIVFTAVFAIGIAATRKRKDENARNSKEQKKVEG